MNGMSLPSAGGGDYADLEIAVHRRDAVTWTVELRYLPPGSEVETKLEASGPLQVDIDPRELDAIEDDEEYGLALGRGLFGGGVGPAFQTAVATSQRDAVPLRVRLVIGSSAAALHGLRWETLRSPLNGATLLTNENILFSRYLSSQDWRPVGVRPREDLDALVVVAGPSDLGSIRAGRPLAPVDVEGELERARKNLTFLDVTTLPGSAGAATATNLIEQVRRNYDVLYLVCHGYVMNDEPVLLLVDDAGRPAPMLASELVQRLQDLSRLPGLVFLASCQSAGAGADRRSEDAGVLAALGPRLAEAGVPAVVAMQGNISMATADAFGAAFFASLEDDGLVDRAAAVARATLRDRPDWWAPAVFMRLKSGRLWYQPGLGDKGPFEKWPSVIADLEDGTCTPVIGPGISDALLGSRREVARSWAQSYRFPMAPYERESLPQVAQYLSIAQGPRFPRRRLMAHLRTTLQERYGEDLPPELLTANASLEDLIAAAWEIRHRSQEVEPYSVLAQLGAPLYVTTQPSRLLVRALTDAGRKPEVELCRWHEDMDWPESVFAREPRYRPTPERPLVYYLLGSFEEPESLVLTEDDYFDFLVGVTRNEDLVPAVIRRRLADSALMFVGFQLDQPDFRVLYRSIMNTEGNRRAGYTHIAVQIDPEEGATIDAGRARKYLEGYFQNAHMSLYWGSSEHFAKDLHKAWKGRST